MDSGNSHIRLYAGTFRERNCMDVSPRNLFFPEIFSFRQTAKSRVGLLDVSSVKVNVEINVRKMTSREFNKSLDTNFQLRIS